MSIPEPPQAVPSPWALPSGRLIPDPAPDAPDTPAGYQQVLGYGLVPTGGQASYGPAPYGPAPYGPAPYGQQLAGQVYGQPLPYGQVYAPAPRTNPLAVAALVLSLVGIFLTPAVVVGIVLGHVGLVQTRRGGDAGRGLAIAALVVGYLVVAWWVLVIAFYAVLLTRTS